MNEGTKSSRPLAVGIDIVDRIEFERDLSLGGQAFLDRIYTDRELAHCAGHDGRLATRFAAKEAVAKALGTGIRGVRWREIEVISAPNGQPGLELSGSALCVSNSLNLSDWLVTLSRTRTLAIAQVIGFAAEL